MQKVPPTVLCVGGLDPSGGAGLAADLITLRDLGCHGAPVMSANTVQDSKNCHAYFPVSSELFKQQIRLLCKDFNLAAIKVGMLGSSALVEALADALPQPLSIPMVIDPVWKAGGGGALAEPDLFSKMLKLLLPACTLITPNSLELVHLLETAGEDPKPATSVDPTPLFKTGVAAILVTGGHLPGDQIEDKLYTQDHKLHCYRWPRQRGNFHGTGCVLSSAICAYLAQQQPLTKAVELAEKYLHARLQEHVNLGQGQAFLGVHRASSERA